MPKHRTFCCASGPNAAAMCQRGRAAIAGRAGNRTPVPSPGLLLVLLLPLGLAAAGCNARSNPADPGAAAPASNAAGDSSSLAVPPVVVTVASAQQRAVERRIAVVGTLRGLDVVTVTPRVEGRVIAAHAEVGERVKPGQTLLELDPTDYQLAVNEAHRSVDQELARLDVSQPPGDEFDIEQLPTVERARLLLENALRQFERQKSLMATNAGSRQDYERTETELKVAEAGVRQARLEARTALATLRHRLAVLAAAEERLSETRVVVPPLSVAAADIATEAARDAAPDTLASPHFVVAQRLVSVGEMVRAFPSTPVYELVVDDVLKVAVMVPERYLALIRLGLDIELRVDAYPGETFRGTVMRIDPTVNPQSRAFRVEARVKNFDHRLRHGGFAKADVIVSRSAEATTVPIVAVTRFAGVSKVFRVRGDKAEEVEIQMGTQGADWVEVLHGLSAGDEVVTSGQSRLAQGTPVRIQPSPAEAPSMDARPSQPAGAP